MYIFSVQPRRRVGCSLLCGYSSLHSFFTATSARFLQRNYGMSHLSDSSLRGVRRSSFAESAPLPHGFLTFVAKCVFSHKPRGSPPMPPTTILGGPGAQNFIKNCVRTQLCKHMRKVSFKKWPICSQDAWGEVLGTQNVAKPLQNESKIIEKLDQN